MRFIYSISRHRKISAKYHFENLVGILSPSWSDDGKKIVFSGLNFSGRNDLYVFDTETRELQQLTDDFYDDIEPSWSPDGRFIVFSSDRTDMGKQWAYNIFTLNISTGELAYVTYGRQKDLAPVFSPDGKYIAFTSDRDLSINIYLTEVDQQCRPRVYYKITHFANAAYDPEWTADGGLLFGVFEDRKFQIRYLPDVVQKKDTVAALAVTNINKSSQPWSFENLSIHEQFGQLNYKKDYDLDIVQSQVSQDPIFGTSGGAQIAFTDLLGNDQYHILIYNNARSSQEFLKSFNFALTKVSMERRTNYALGIFRYAGRYFNYDESFFYEDRVGAFLALSYPLSQFTRFQYSTSFSYLDKERYGDTRFFSYLFSNFFSYVKDNSLWTHVGPIDGQRFNITLGNTFDMRYSNISYYTIMADYRHYFRLTLRSAYAVRLLYLRNEGREARRFYFGGSWDMRGYPNWSIRSDQILFMSHELRFPFIDRLGIGLPFGTLGFNSIRSTLFFDACSLGPLDVDNLDRTALGSFGIGFRITPFPYFVLRLDVGKTTDFSRVSNGIFTQFFFGWDF